MLRIRGRAQDHLAGPEHRAVPEDGDSVDPIGIRNATEQGVRREGEDRDQLERPEQHEADECEQERAAEVHPAAEAVRERDRPEGRHKGGDPDRHAAQEDPHSVEGRINEEISLHHREREDRGDNPPRRRRDEQPPCDPRRLGVALARRLRPEDVHQPAFTASMIRRKASPSRATSTIVPVTTMSAPARVTAWAAFGVRMPPPTRTGMSIASRTARITRSGTGSGAPLPASRYTSFMPSIWAARAYWTATIGFLREISSASPTSPARIPGSTTRYAIGMASRPQARTIGAASRCSPTIRRGSRLFRRLMKYNASACGDRFAALAGKRITGTFAASLIARTVASTLSCVTPVEPPTMIASVPAAAASEDREAASGGVCLSGSSNVMWSGPFRRRSKIDSYTFTRTHLRGRPRGRRSSRTSSRAGTAWDSPPSGGRRK